ncbi:MAG TPA: hypothetical protein VIX91_21335 [Candidatus Acidoferrum sp.]
MAPKQRQKIEIEKTHRDPLLSFNQAVTVDCSDFLGTALEFGMKSRVRGEHKPYPRLAGFSLANAAKLLKIQGVFSVTPLAGRDTRLYIQLVLMCADLSFIAEIPAHCISEIISVRVLVCCFMLTSSLNRVLAASLPWECIVNSSPQ